MKIKTIGTLAIIISAVFVLNACVNNNQFQNKKPDALSEVKEKAKDTKEKVEKEAEQTKEKMEDVISSIEADSSETKTEKPKVELFVMSYCPFGTQIQKGILPVVETLGDKIEISNKFVNYVMHGDKEIKENINQYCIQKEEPEKYWDYLKCFLKEGKSDDCLLSEKIAKDKLAECKTATNEEFKLEESGKSGQRYPAFGIHQAENEKYKVKGSPTLVINGKVVKANRDSASLLATICDAFKTRPEECDKKLSTTSPSPGFGEGVSTTSNGGCGG